MLYFRQTYQSSADSWADSCLIYSPYLRHGVWRFFTYIFIHVDIWHLLINLSLQLLVGAPLEMSHGTPRVASVYLCGVFSGSLSTSVLNSSVYLAGASGKPKNSKVNFSSMKSHFHYESMNLNFSLVF